MNKGIIFIVVLALVVIGAIYFTNGKSTGNAVNIPDQVQVINMEAHRWEFAPNIITVKVNKPVKLQITNTDTPHGLFIPELGVKGIDTVEFTPNQTGTFQFRCPTMCGKGHMNMTGTLIVTE